MAETSPPSRILTRLITEPRRVAHGVARRFRGSRRVASPLRRAARTDLSGALDDPARYWEGRADELAETYDHPETWSSRGWPDDELERQVVPELLADAEIRSVLVIGCGSGRQYQFLKPLGMELSGFDISPTLVAICRQRYPQIPTRVDNLIGANHRWAPTDAVYSSHVLQHIDPGSIHQAVDAVKALSKTLIVIRETTFLEHESYYQWAHNYEALFHDWMTCMRVTTEDAPSYRAELIAWRPPLASTGAGVRGAS